MLAKYRELHRLLLWRDLPQGWDPRQSFSVERPLFLEIGFGNGEYTARQAESRPQHNFLGLEMHWESVRRCLRRLSWAQLDNVRLMQVDAQTALHYLLPDDCCESFIALFPCPWPRRDQRHLRLFSSEFMNQLGRVCRAGGMVVTDHRGLVEFALEQAKSSHLDCQMVEVPASYNTKYERRWQGQGQQVFFELHYQPRPGVARAQRKAEANVQTLWVKTADPQSVQLSTFQEPDLVIHFQESLFDPVKQLWMVLTVVVEDHLKQTFWIESRWRPEEGGWAIRPALGGGFLPTLGVQRALGLVQQAFGNLPQTGEVALADAKTGPSESLS